MISFFTAALWQDSVLWNLCSYVLFEEGMLTACLVAATTYLMKATLGKAIQLVVHHDRNGRAGGAGGMPDHDMVLPIFYGQFSHLNLI